MSEPSTVLVVDDEIGPRESLRAILKPEYQVLVATEGEQAIQMVEKVPVDVVLLDLRMPGVSGIRVLERVKANHPDIEVILITGYASYETVLEALRLHAFDYIPKPFNIPQLRDLVRRAVTRRQSYLQKSVPDDEVGARQVMLDTQPSKLAADLTATQKQLEAVRALLSCNFHGALQTVAEGSRALATNYASQLDASGKELLQRVHAAALTLAESVQSVLPLQESQSIPSPWATTPTSIASSNSSAC